MADNSMMQVRPGAGSTDRTIRDDRIFPETKWIGLAVVAFLAVAFVMLYFLPFPCSSPTPCDTPIIFAWSIIPTMTSMLMGAGYIAGSYFFLALFVGTRFHRFTWGFLAITAFTWFQGLTSILHLDKFNGFPVSVWAWLGLYFTTPFIVPILWLRNRVTDPGTPEPDDIVVPQSVRTGALIFGIALALMALFLLFYPIFVAPDPVKGAIPIWPWKLTPLTAGVVGGFFSLPGTVALTLSREPRWSCWRVLIVSQLIGIGLIVIAAFRALSEFDQSNPLTWVFVFGMILLWLAMLGLYLWMESRRRATTQVQAANT